MPFTNRGKFRIFQGWFRNVNVPTSFNLALCTALATPTPDTNSFSELSEIAAGNGYTAGGKSIARNGTVWDVLTEDDSLDRVLIQLADQTWLPSGGPIPASGSDAAYVVLLDDNGTIGSRDVLAYATIVPGPIHASDAQLITLQNLEFQVQ